MYISNYTKYATGTFDIDNLQNSINSLQQQLDTQLRVNKPSDDPVAATQILQLDQSSQRNQQFVTNGQTVSSNLGLVSTALGNALNTLASMKSLVVQAGNGTLNATQLQMLQQQVNQNYNELLSYANATDGRGSYLFGGNKIDNPPFSADVALTATYQGDTGQRVVQIGDSRSLPVTMVGTQIFGNATSGTALFDAVQQLSQLLGTNPKPATYDTQLQAIMSSLDNAQNVALTNQASIGAALRESNTAQSSGQGLNLQYQTAIGNLQNLDLPKAISDLTMAQTALQYSNITYSKVTQLSLFNYIN